MATLSCFKRCEERVPSAQRVVKIGLKVNIPFLQLQEACWRKYGRKWNIAYISAVSRRAPILNLCKEENGPKTLPHLIRRRNSSAAEICNFG
ncbi:hypothetical protein TNCT_449961 [Trichonephila clavata]|uniref:Uncharacterized protein n=1 Tax=Trichonephila clavata TaxID=2740835 RepID=A0A8X6KXJ2_TRICU|nr:hypothetical protein TNCT_449961 [Trichonephila clavata]